MVQGASSYLVAGATYYCFLPATGIEPDLHVWVESALTIGLHCPHVMPLKGMPTTYLIVFNNFIKTIISVEQIIY